MSDTSKPPANRLAGETSPYLLQHAHNPVDWFPWGPEALAKAKAEDRPIFLSIGYSACHWCHVMERESFENPDIAALMNERYVNIKVDREERPDLDNLYMAAVQALTGQGGWPMSVFLTPDLEPFYGGTYYPPSRLARDARLPPGAPERPAGLERAARRDPQGRRRDGRAAPIGRRDPPRRFRGRTWCQVARQRRPSPRSGVRPDPRRLRLMPPSSRTQWTSASCSASTPGPATPTPCTWSPTPSTR